MIIANEVEITIDNIPFTFKVLYEKSVEEPGWLGRCLEMNLVVAEVTGMQEGLAAVQGDLLDVMRAQIDFAMKNNNMEHVFHSAPQEEWSKYFDARGRLPKCECGKVMRGSDGCDIGTVFFHEEEFPRIPYGYETRSNEGPWSVPPLKNRYSLSEDSRCHDCDVPLGKWHQDRKSVV